MAGRFTAAEQAHIAAGHATALAECLRLRTALEAILASPYLCERAWRGARCGHPGCLTYGPLVEQARAALGPRADVSQQ